MTLKKLSELIEEAEELSDKQFKKTKYWFYQNLSIELRDIQRSIDKQDQTELEDE